MTAAKQAKRCGIHIAFDYREGVSQGRPNPSGPDQGDAARPVRPAVRKIDAIASNPAVSSSVSPTAQAAATEASSEWMVKAPRGALRPTHLSPPGVRGGLPDRRLVAPPVVESPGRLKTRRRPPPSLMSLPRDCREITTSRKCRESCGANGGSSSPPCRPSSGREEGRRRCTRATRSSGRTSRTDAVEAGAAREGAKTARAPAAGENQTTRAGIRAPRVLAQTRAPRVSRSPGASSLARAGAKTAEGWVG